MIQEFGEWIAKLLNKGYCQRCYLFENSINGCRIFLQTFFSQVFNFILSLLENLVFSAASASAKQADASQK